MKPSLAAAPPASQIRDVPSLVTGLIGLAACAFAALVDLAWGLTHDNYSYVADTISDLAAGANSWTQDLAINGLAVAIGLIGLALLRWNVDSWRWTAGGSMIVALAVIVYFIAAHDAYGDGEPGGLVIHDYLVYALGLGFPLTAFLMAPDFGRFSQFWRSASTAIGGLWMVLTPYFLFMATSWDGLYERGLAALLLTWLALASWMLLRRGRGRLGMSENSPAESN